MRQARFRKEDSISAASALAPRLIPFAFRRAALVAKTSDPQVARRPRVTRPCPNWGEKSPQFILLMLKWLALLEARDIWDRSTRPE
jgi:hypothetical protein